MRRNGAILLIIALCAAAVVPGRLNVEAKPKPVTEWKGRTERSTEQIDPKHTVSSVDVLIDVGHGGVDGGTSHGSLLEKQINLAIGIKLYEKLQKDGVHVALNRSKDYAPSDDNEWLGNRSRHLRDLAQRKLVMDTLKPKLTVSLHTNWAAKTSQRGPGVLYAPNQHSYVASGLFADRLNRLYGTSEKPYHGKTFYLLKRAKTPLVIVEMGYISSPSDRAMLTGDKGQERLTEALASAVLDYLLLYHYMP